MHPKPELDTSELDAWKRARVQRQHLERIQKRLEALLYRAIPTTQEGLRDFIQLNQELVTLKQILEKGLMRPGLCMLPEQQVK